MEGEIATVETAKVAKTRRNLTPEEIVEKNRLRQKEYRSRTKRRELMKKYDLTDEEVDEYLACEARLKELREKHKVNSGSEDGDHE